MKQDAVEFHTRLTQLAIAAALALGCGVALAQAGGANVIHGQASFATQGNQLTISTRNGAGTRHSAIDWQAFSVPQGSVTRFVQPDAASTSINRVLGGDPSRILGTLSSNGRLVLVNPAGIAVGQGAAVDTAGFTASTLRMSDADARAGRLRFDGGLAGAMLQVDGSVVAQVGDVVLIASNVAVGAGALVRAPDGSIVLAAGQSVELTGRGLEGIRMALAAPSDSAVNLGALQGDAVGLFAANVRHSGFIRATGAELDGSKLQLVATRSSVVDGIVRIGRDLALSQEVKAKDDKERDEKDKDKDKDQGKDRDGKNKDDVAQTQAPAPAVAPTPAPAPAPSAPAPTPASQSAPAPAPVPAAPMPAPAPGAGAPAPAPATAPAQVQTALQSAPTMAPQVIAQAATEQRNQVISFLAQPVAVTLASASDDLRLTLDRNAPGKDALQCVP